jgi:hypothetical protein
VFYRHIEKNLLTGTIPQNISQLIKLQKLYPKFRFFFFFLILHRTFNSNFLDGTLPAELGQNADLIYLYAFNPMCSLYVILIFDFARALNNNNFGGTIPVEWSNLTLLEQMYH